MNQSADDSAKREIHFLSKGSSHTTNHSPRSQDSLIERKIYVGNFPSYTKPEHLRRVFGAYGMIEKVEMKTDGSGNHYAFIRYENKDSVTW